jgi:hypothetical protein
MTDKPLLDLVAGRAAPASTARRAPCDDAADFPFLARRGNA